MWQNPVTRARPLRLELGLHLYLAEWPWTGPTLCTQALSPAQGRCRWKLPCGLWRGSYPWPTGSFLLRIFSALLSNFWCYFDSQIGTLVYHLRAPNLRLSQPGATSRGSRRAGSPSTPSSWMAVLRAASLTVVCNSLFLPWSFSSPVLLFYFLCRSDHCLPLSCSLIGLISCALSPAPHWDE